MFYGWKIVGVTWFCHFVTAGFIFYSYGIFLPFLTEELHGGRQAASWSLAFMSISTSLFAPFLGRALDHGNTRNIMAIGTITLGVGFIMASRVTAFWQFNLLLASFVGLGAAAFGGLPCTTLVANWFVRKRGKALGISTMGVSFSGMIMVPVTAQLIALIGWRNTFAVYGFATLGIILPVVWHYVVRSPEDIGLTPDGMPMNGESVEAYEPVIPVAPGDQLIDHPGHLEWSTVSALRDRNFWVINTTVGLCFFCMGAILTHLTAHLIDLGFSATAEAPFIVATSAGVGAIGKLLFGWVADHIETRVVFWIAIVFLIAGTTLILFAETLPEFLRAAGVYGFGMGGIVPLYASLIGDAYGRANFGRIMGLMSLTMLPIHVGGLPFAGWVYDQHLNYDLAYKTFIVVFAVSACILAGLRKNGQNGNAPPIAPE
jgi:OFA family oxalate/formate antiporter-like MFS transporter